MNYSDRKLQSLLAAEYVLGNMPDLPSRRFERLLETEPGLRRSLDYWQRRLNPLAENVTPMQPPKRVWSSIQHRIRHGSAINIPQSKSMWSDLYFWRGFSLASVMLLLVVVLLSFQQQGYDYIPDFEAQTVAVLQDQAAKPKLVAMLQEGGQALVLEMLVQPEDMGPGKVMQVWCVPKGNGKPVSLGLLNAKRNRFELSLDQVQELHDAEEIAISVEPANGAPMDKPTGPVMYRGSII